MNENGSNTGRKDLRPLALLLFALGILTVTGVRMGGISDLFRQDSPPQKLAWREGSVAPGLYRVPADSPAGNKEPQAGPGPEPKMQSPGTSPARLAPLFFKPIPVNQADEELLITIPGIGPAFARRIIDFRQQHGRISAIEELDAVKGVGPAKLKILKTHLVAD